MGWPYQFLDLDSSAKAERRDALDRYALYAQLSAVMLVAAFLALRAVSRVASAAFSRGAVSTEGGGSGAAYNIIPDSPARKLQRRSAWGGWASRLRRTRWWLGDEVFLLGEHRGTRDVWVFGSLWAAWLLLLCVLGTGNDYLHLTKRFGIIAASQFPIQYLLSLKFLNPFAYVFGVSHEQVNRWHRAQGRVVYLLLFLHASFYLNYFVQMGILQRRLFAPIVFAGSLSWLGINLLMATALPVVRRFSYRLFFITHLMVSFCVPPLLLYHASPARPSMVAALTFVVVDIVVRRLVTVAGRATLEYIPGTSLVKISLAIPHGKINAFREHPGSHVYLSLPAASRPDPNPASIGSLLYEFLFNPFTVADVDDSTGDLTLVARHRGGPFTAALARFARANKASVASPATPTSSRRLPPLGSDRLANYDENSIPLCIEGPYGAAAHFPHLAGPDFDRVLLVAGGVGATFAVPLYRALLHDNPSAKVELVWALRGAGDATWALTNEGGAGDSSASSTARRNILTDDNVHLFLTGDVMGSSSASSSDGAATAAATAGSLSLAPSSSAGENNGVELNALYRDRRRGRYTALHNRRRPDLRKIVDDTFKHGLEERVAVLVCGPDEMARETREYVGAWVMRGRHVWFHEESFGW